MTFRQWLTLTRLTLRESGWGATVILFGLLSFIPVFVSMVVNKEVRTVAVSGSGLIPTLDRSLKAAGFEVRDAEPDEVTDMGRGIVVLRVRKDGPLRHAVRIDSMLSVTVTAYDGTSRIILSVMAAAKEMNKVTLEHAGIPPEAMNPIRYEDFPEPISLRPADRRASDESTGDYFRVATMGLLRRSSLVSLGIGWGVAWATCISVLIFGRRSGRLQALVCVPVTPRSHVWAIMATSAVTAFVTLAAVCLPMAGGLAYFGIEVPAKFAVLPFLAGFFAATLAPFACVGMSLFKNPKFAATFGNILTSPLLGIAYIPYLASFLGFGSQWLHSVPFEGMTLWALTGQVQALPAFLSFLATLSLLALGQWLAARRLDARFYLGHDD